MPFDATPINTVADTLRRAKALIPDEEAWFQGSWGRTLPTRGESCRGQHCVRTAICMSVHDTRLVTEAEKIFKRANNIPDAPLADMAIPFWNNADERVFADIHPAFDKAIALAESE